MLSKILGALTIVRHAVAITLVTGAATAMVAGSLDVPATGMTTDVTASTTATAAVSSKNTTNADLDAFIKACLATKDTRSAECGTAMDKSGLSESDFWANVAMSLHEQLGRQTSEHTTGTPKPEPTKKPETSSTHPATGELLGLVTACVESHERSSEACQKALEASGLSTDDFFAKVAAHFGRTTEPTTKPADKTGGTEGVTILVKDCLMKYESARTTHESGEAASEACKKAIEASGLSANDFWARFGPKTNTEPTRKPDTTKKTEPTTKPTTRPEGTPTVTTAQLAVLVKDCFAKYQIAKETHEGGAAAVEACNKAIAASGLSPDAFWKRFGYPGAATS
jgi:hypothetical protein